MVQLAFDCMFCYFIDNLGSFLILNSVFISQAVVFGVIVIAGAFIVKYVGTMVLQVSTRCSSLSTLNLC